LAVAQENLTYHGLAERVQLFEGDLYQPLPKESRYELILSNPPYVSEAEYAGLPSEYRQEPKLGLTAPEDGLAIVVRLLRHAAQYLSEEGILICEVGNSAEALQARYPQVPFVWLDFERGGEGVFMLTAAELRTYQF
jgi:ribosomal protein L3 glutamine methyltransferase